MKITKTQLKQIIEEELGRVLNEEDGPMEGAPPEDDTDALYDRYWKQAVENYYERSSNIDQYYEDYDPNSPNDKASWHFRFAISHLNSLLGRNPQPTDEEIIDAIHEGWHEGDYSRREQEDMDREY